MLHDNTGAKLTVQVVRWAQVLACLADLLCGPLVRAWHTSARHDCRNFIESTAIGATIEPIAITVDVRLRKCCRGRHGGGNDGAASDRNSYPGGLFRNRRNPVSVSRRGSTTIQPNTQTNIWMDKQTRSGQVPFLQVCDFCDHLGRYFNMPLDFYC